MPYVEVYLEDDDEWIQGFKIRAGKKNTRVRYEKRGVEHNILFPNQHVREISGSNNQNDGSLKEKIDRVIPITPLRPLYRAMRKLTGSKELKLSNLEERLSPIQGIDAADFLLILSKRSIAHFSVYENAGDPFVQNPEGRTKNPQQNGFARDILDRWRNEELVEGFRFVDYEINPPSTTRSCYETGESGEFSSRGGMDLLLERNGRPVVGEIKASTETVGVTFALLQSLVYATELSTPAQLKRLSNFYSSIEEISSCVEIAVIIESKDQLAEGDWDLAQSIAEGLIKDPDFSASIASIGFYIADLSQEKIVFTEKTVYPA